MNFLLAALLFFAGPLGAAASDGSLLEDAKKSQDAAAQGRDRAQTRVDLLAERTKDLARAMDGVVSELEMKGILFERVQGDSKLNPLPELIAGKVGLERHRKPPRVILKPKGREGRIYLEIVWTSPSGWGFVVKIRESGGGADRSVGGDDLRGAAAITGLTPRLREALLRRIANKD